MRPSRTPSPPITAKVTNSWSFHRESGTFGFSLDMLGGGWCSWQLLTAVRKCFVCKCWYCTGTGYASYCTGWQCGVWDCIMTFYAWDNFITAALIYIQNTFKIEHSYKSFLFYQHILWYSFYPTFSTPKMMLEKPTKWWMIWLVLVRFSWYFLHQRWKIGFPSFCSWVWYLGGPCCGNKPLQHLIITHFSGTEKYISQ